MNEPQRQFIDRAEGEAIKAGHPFACMAACEAALESNYGLSQVAREGNNLFGMKQHSHPIYGTMVLPTREFENGEWIAIGASWVNYPDWCACFRDRCATLERLSNAFIHYALALSADTPQKYISEVSKTWATDPQRGAKVLAIYQEYQLAPSPDSPTGEITQ